MSIIQQINLEINKRLRLVQRFNDDYNSPINMTNLNRHTEAYSNSYKLYANFSTTSFFNRNSKIELKIKAMTLSHRLHEELDNFAMDIVKYFSRHESQHDEPAKDLTMATLSEAVSRQVQQYFRPETLKKIKMVFKETPVICKGSEIALKGEIVHVAHSFAASNEAAEIHMYDVSPKNYYADYNKPHMEQFEVSNSNDEQAPLMNGVNQ